MNAENIRRALISQHECLREQLQICTRLAKLYRLDESIGSELDAALEALRDQFALHNETETAVITKLMYGVASRKTLMIDRMFEEHVAEHAAFWELLSGTRAETVGRIEDLADELDAHMAAEERTFLAPIGQRHVDL